MGDRQAKDALFDAFAEVAKALGSGRRAEIVDVLAQGERSVEAIAEELGQSLANTSHQFPGPGRAGLVRTRRDGTRIFCALASERVATLWAALRDVAAEHVAGIEHLATAYLGDRASLEAITRTELVARMAAGDVVVLDVRPGAEYRAGHIPGARSVPPGELRRNLAALSKGTDVVAYCRGPYCVYADDAVTPARPSGLPGAAAGGRVPRVEAGGTARRRRRRLKGACPCPTRPSSTPSASAPRCGRSTAPWLRSPPDYH